MYKRENLGKTTGFGHRASLKMKKVNMINAVTYQKIDDQGLHIERKGEHQILDVDHVIICAGQIPNKDLVSSLEEGGMTVHIIGGAKKAGELDAKRAINDGAWLAAEL